MGRTVEKNYGRGGGRLLWVACLAAFFCIWPGVFAPRAAEAHPRDEVLVLHSYCGSLDWVRELDRGIEEGLGKTGREVSFFVEHLDSNTVGDLADREGAFARYLLSKYSQKSLSLIVVTDNDAYNFIRQYHQMVFYGVPVVFAGVNNLEEAEVPREWMTGVAEVPSFATTFKVMLDLQPELRKVVVLGDESVTYEANKAMLQQQLADAGIELELVFIEASALAEMLVELAQVKDYQAILAMGRYQDEHQNLVEIRDIPRAVGKVTALPIYSCWDFWLGSGVVGGRVVSAYRQGMAAAALGGEILQGKSPSQIPIELSSPNEYIFDYQAMQRHGLNPGRLPIGAKIINRPESYYQQHRTVINVSVVVVSLLTILIIALLFNIRKRHLAEAAYRQLSEHLEEKVVEKTQDLEISLAKLQEMQVQLVRSEKMAALVNVIIGVSHEINTPLGNALLSCSVCEDNLKNLQSVEAIEQKSAAEVLDILSVEQESWELTRTCLQQVVERLRKFEQIHLDDEAYMQMEFDLCALVHQVAEKFQPRLAEQGHVVTVDCQMPRLVYGNPTAVRRTAEIIVENAVAHGLKCRQGGSIGIEVHFSAEGMCQIRIANTGEPLPEESMGRIFDPFFSLAAEAGYAGLGLSVAYNLVTKTLRGYIECERSDATETAFVFVFPIQHPPEE
jgi:signal transduction histidine kinase